MKQMLWTQSLYSKITNPTMCESVFWFMPHNMLLCVCLCSCHVSVCHLYLWMSSSHLQSPWCAHIYLAATSSATERIEWCVQLQLLAPQVQSRLSRSLKQHTRSQLEAVDKMLMMCVFILNACLITRLYGYKLQADAMYAESEVKRHSIGI